MKENLKDIPISLPDLEIEEPISTLSQTIDWGLNQSNVPSTWKVSKGEGITILVIDTGKPDHPDLNKNLLGGKNFIDGETIEDGHGHHTHCAGIIAGLNNDMGMVGVAPESKIISAKALSNSGSGSYSSLAKALDYAIDIKPDIVSMSLGSPTPSDIIHDKIKTLYELNIPVVCSAGNSGLRGVSYPAAFPETIAVAAYDENGKIAYFSSVGKMVDWAAPGVSIYSTYLNSRYTKMSGTSMACPFLVGVIALMLSKHKKQEENGETNDCKTVEDIRNHLLKYTMDYGPKGKDWSWGYGVVNVEKLILGGEMPTPEPSPSPKPKPTPEPKPKPSPEPKPKPSPEPKPKPSPEPKPKPSPQPTPKPIPTPPSKIKKNLAWIVLGTSITIIVTIITFIIYSNMSNNNIPEEWLNEDGSINFDKKFESEIKNKNR